MRVAILGSGAGASATAYDFAAHGHRVGMFDFEARRDVIAAVGQAGGVRAIGEMEGFAPLAYAGHDIDRVVDGADLVIVVATANRTRAFGENCRGRLAPGQMVIVSPGSCMGALEFKQAAGFGLKEEGVIAAETSTLP